MTTSTENENQKLLKQKSPLVKAASIFFWIWIAVVTGPCVYFVLSHADAIREFAVVAAVGKTNQILTEQYATFTSKVLNEVKIEKYTSKIKVPEIKLDKLEKANKVAEKTKKISSTLSKIGIKQADKIEDSTAKIQEQINSANRQIQTTIDQVKKTLNEEIQTGLKKEIGSLAETQIQKQLALTDQSYKNLETGKYGLTSAAKREVTEKIYAELSKNKNGVFKDVISAMEKYYKWIMGSLILLIIVVTMIPPVLFKKIAKKLSSTFTQCPYCGKIYVTKANAFNILKILKP